MDQKLRAVPLYGRGGGSPSNTGPRPTCTPSFILIRPTVWPQYTNVTDRTDRQTYRQRSDSIGRTVLQTVAQKRSPMPTTLDATNPFCGYRLHMVTYNMSAAVAEMGDRGHNRHRPKRWGAAMRLSRRAWTPSTSVPNCVFIYPAVWPQ